MTSKPILRYTEPMFDDPTPEEQARLDLANAIKDLDADQILRIGRAFPQAVQAHASWRLSPMQMIVHHRDQTGMLPALDALIACGARLDASHNGACSALQTLLRRADLATLEHLHNTGALDQVVLHSRALSYVCTPTQWRDMGRDYPLHALVELLLDAGDLPREHVSGQSVGLRMIPNAKAQYGRPVPEGIEDTILLLLDRDDPSVSAHDILNAYHAEIPRVFSAISNLYIQDKGLAAAQAGIEEVSKHLKAADQRADFMAKWMHETTDIAPPENTENAKRLRF